MRQVSGTGSDDDRTDETLRKRENAARQRRGDDENMLPGRILLQRVLPAGSVFNTIEDTMVAMRALGHVGHGTATMMMMMMVAVPRRGRGNGSVRNGMRDAARLTSQGSIAMTVTAIFKILAIRGGPKLPRAAGMEKRRRQAMMMMPMIVMVVRRAASVAAGILFGRREKLGRYAHGQVPRGARRLKRVRLLPTAASAACQIWHSWE